MQVLVNIDVADLAQATDFYCRAFELKPGRRFGADGVELLGANAAIYLLVKPAGTPAWPGGTQLRDYARHWTPVHLDIVVDDAEATVARCLAAGATQEQPMRTANWGKIALMADPFGNGFCVAQFLGRGYDEVATST